MKTAMKLVLFGLVLGGLTLTSCKKEDNQITNPNGAFKVRMTDAPADYEALNLSVVSVEAYNESSGWIMLNSQTQSFNVLDLNNGVETTLAYNAEMEAGSYSMIRLRFASQASLTEQHAVTIGGLTTTSSVSSNLQWSGPTEIIIPISARVSSSQSADILLDFNVAQSIIESGQNHLIKPMIEVVENESTGVEGSIQGAAQALVQINAGGTTLSSYINAQGEFLLRGLEPGSYTLHIIPSEADVLAGAPEEFTVSNVSVSEGRITNAGSIKIF
jgi:hypothetical protein